MSWTHEGEYWRRPLDCHDKMFRSIAAAGAPFGREHWLMAGWLQLGFPSTIDSATQEQRLRGAWSALRLRHPDIALTLHEDEKRYAPLTDDQALEQWTNVTFRISTEAGSVDELFSRHLKVAPSMHATCYWVPASSEVAIVSSHWRWDGRGLIMMLHSFMVLLGCSTTPSPTMQAVVGSEAANLVPTLDAVMGMPVTPKDEWTVFPKDVTTALREACRARRLRLTAALHASVVLETARYYNQEEGGAAKANQAKYKSWAAFDLRKYCLPSPDSSSHAPSIRMVAFPLIADPAASWETLASKFQAYYAQSLVPPDSEAIFVRVPYVEKATAMLATAPPTTEPNLSNLGVLENYVKERYGDFEVRNVALAVHMLSPQLYVHAWSWGGEMRVSICYNEAFYEERFVQEWLEAVKANLLKNL
ncbi:hypothetical protein K445DRAFT_36957, partial [Daldinia sp. EC12]